MAGAGGAPPGSARLGADRADVRARPGGPVGHAHLRRHGVLWPPFAHFHVADLRAGRQAARSSPASEGTRCCRGAPLGRLRGGAGCAVEPAGAGRGCSAPGAVRRAAFARRAPVDFPWLPRRWRPRSSAGATEWRARTPYRWDASIARLVADPVPRRPGRPAWASSPATPGPRSSVVFVEPTVVGALWPVTSVPGARPAANAALRELFGDVLPDRRRDPPDQGVLRRGVLRRPQPGLRRLVDGHRRRPRAGRPRPAGGGVAVGPAARSHVAARSSTRGWRRCKVAAIHREGPMDNDATRRGTDVPSTADHVRRPLGRPHPGTTRDDPCRIDKVDGPRGWLHAAGPPTVGSIWRRRRWS